MKRFLAILLLLSAMTGLCACGAREEPVKFYYPRSEVQYSSPDGVIAAESRDSLSRSDSLPYLLSFYLEGPISSDLALPVPAGTRILKIHRIETDLTLVMSWEFAQLTGMDLTTACGCISATCFDLTDAEKITFCVGSEDAAIRTITRSSLTLTDTVTTGAETTTESP